MLKTTQKELYAGSNFMICGICGGATSSFNMITNECDRDKGRDDCDGSDLRKKVTFVPLEDCVFMKSFYTLLLIFCSVC